MLILPFGAGQTDRPGRSDATPERDMGLALGRSMRNSWGTRTAAGRGWQRR